MPTKVCGWDSSTALKATGVFISLSYPPQDVVVV